MNNRSLNEVVSTVQNVKVFTKLSHLSTLQCTKAKRPMKAGQIPTAGKSYAKQTICILKPKREHMLQYNADHPQSQIRNYTNTNVKTHAHTHARTH